MHDTPSSARSDTSDRLPDDYVNPYYLEDLKRRVVRRPRRRQALRLRRPLHRTRPARSPPGLLTGTTLMCQCHGSQFDVTTGAVLRGPATKPLATYEVREEDGEIQMRA